MWWHCVAVFNVEIGVGKRTEDTLGQEAEWNNLLLLLQSKIERPVLVNDYFILFRKLTLLVVEGARQNSLFKFLFNGCLIDLFSRVDVDLSFESHILLIAIATVMDSHVYKSRP